MAILVTGSAGFIGSAVIRHIIRFPRHRLVNLDKLTYAGNLESLAEVSASERYSFEQVDICDRVQLERVFKTYQPYVVMHLAAEWHVDRSIDRPTAFIETNIVGIYTLLEASREYWRTLTEDKPTGVGRYEDLITYVQDRPAHDKRYAIDAGKIQRELGWAPQERFEIGIRKAVEWGLANSDWYNVFRMVPISASASGVLAN